MSPLFAPLIPYAELFGNYQTFPSPEAIHEALSSFAGVSFARSGPPKRGPRRPQDLYDFSISELRAVPTRDGSWHDFLNALVWALFPESKRALHERQHRLVVAGLDPETGKLPGARTREQDALALFDEGGLVVTAAEVLDGGEAIEEAVAAKRATAVVFGHAIYESIVLGVGWPTVRAVVIDAPQATDVDVSARDRNLAARLASSDEVRDPATLPRVRLERLLPLPR